MGFLNKINKIIVLNYKVKKLTKRIDELTTRVVKIESTRRQLESSNIDISWYKISSSNSSSYNREIEVFDTYQINRVITWSYLLRRRNLTTQIIQPKQDEKSILQYLYENDVSEFYHFTDEENLRSIRLLGGLYSWDFLHRNNIVIPNQGGTSFSMDLDRKHGIGDYVHLSFCSDHPMAYRKHLEGSCLVLLIISVDVAAFLNTIFTDKNATSNLCNRGRSLEDLQRVDIWATQQHFVRRGSPIFEKHQAECMVKTFIPIKYIININNPPVMQFGNENRYDIY